MNKLALPMPGDIIANQPILGNKLLLAMDISTASQHRYETNLAEPIV
jgi:hypothetical protein